MESCFSAILEIGILLVLVFSLILISLPHFFYFGLFFHFMIFFLFFNMHLKTHFISAIFFQLVIMKVSQFSIFGPYVINDDCVLTWDVVSNLLQIQWVCWLLLVSQTFSKSHCIWSRHLILALIALFMLGISWSDLYFLPSGLIDLDLMDDCMSDILEHCHIMIC